MKNLIKREQSECICFAESENADKMFVLNGEKKY